MHAAYPRNNDSLSHSTHSINYCTLALSLASSQLQRRFSPPPPPLPPHTQRADDDRHGHRPRDLKQARVGWATRGKRSRPRCTERTGRGQKNLKRRQPQLPIQTTRQGALPLPSRPDAHARRGEKTFLPCSLPSFWHGLDTVDREPRYHYAIAMLWYAIVCYSILWS
ncbi:hypothetical protein GGS24DRAFT_146332 [Hypoxylon argillaceum]|nr:hypothetical protein GGS24DRAFT_146332 [Hypoxylon argillaceum]